MASRYPQFAEQRPGRPGLTERQRQVLQGVVDGFTNQKIGSMLGVSESSIKGTLQQLFARASVRTRSQLVRAVLEGSLGEGAHDAQREPGV